MLYCQYLAFFNNLHVFIYIIFVFMCTKECAHGQTKRQLCRCQLSPLATWNWGLNTVPWAC